MALVFTVGLSKVANKFIIYWIIKFTQNAGNSVENVILGHISSYFTKTKSQLWVCIIKPKQTWECGIGFPAIKG